MDSIFSVAGLLLGAFFLGALVVLSGVALGAYVVFRTKREPHEPFMRLQSPQGEAWTDDVVVPAEEEGDLNAKYQGLWKEVGPGAEMFQAQFYEDKIKGEVGSYEL
jgi:hypothetical protein